MRFEIIERHIINVPDSELTDGERPLGKMALVEVLDVIAENPRRFIERYEMYREEVIRLGGKPTCAECIKMYECCCDYGICEVEFDDAFREKFDGADAEPGDVAYWALPWIADHMRDMQEEACAMFCG